MNNLPLKLIKTSKLSAGLYAFWIYTLVVILWGAWVRISHSGHGCGDHWPLCNGDLIPALGDKKTLVEFSHRIMSGLYGIIVIGICFYFFKLKKTVDNKNIKILSWFLLGFMILEALLGALLVKKNLVTVNDSIFRLVAMSLHQLNSFLLTGTTYLIYKSTYEKMDFKITKLNLTVLILAVSGAIASLASTLFPSTSILEGILKDFSAESHLFIRLRVIHPTLALISVSSIIYWLYTKSDSSKSDIRLALKLFFAMLVGIITILTLSPVWLKLAHLLIAHFIWAEILEHQLFRKH